MTAFDLPAVLSSLRCTHIRVPPRGWVYHAGQPHPGIYFVRAGFLKTVIGTDDGRERVCAFPMRGEWLGLEALGSRCHAADCVALDESEVWHLPDSALEDAGVAAMFAKLCAQQLREQHAWALQITTLCAERRVVEFLEELGRRHAGIGCSAHRFRLRMTRAEMGNFLGLKIETVTRALAKLQAAGTLSVDRRDVILHGPEPRDDTSDANASTVTSAREVTSCGSWRRGNAPAQPPAAPDRRVSAGFPTQTSPGRARAHALT